MTPVAAGLAARVLLVAWTSPLELSLDETRFWDLAGSRMAGTAFLPPLYPFVLALLRAMAGDDLATVRVLQCLLATASIPLVLVLGERHLGPGRGRGPAWIVALLPALIHFDGRLRSEWLLVILLVVFAVLWTTPAGGRWMRFGAGLVAGLIGLVRPEFLLLPAILVWLDARKVGWRAAFARGAVIVPGLLLVLLPWAARNRVVVGTWALTTNAGYNFWKSFNSMTDGSQTPVDDFSRWRDVREADANAVGFQAGRDYIASHPVRSAALSAAKIGHLFGPDRDFLSAVRRLQFPRRSLWIDVGFAVMMNLAWLALLAAGVCALAGGEPGGVRDLILGTLLTLVLVHLVFFGDDRFHVPWLPFLAVAAPGILERSPRMRAAASRLIPFLVLLVGFWSWIVVRDLGRIETLWAR